MKTEFTRGRQRDDAWQSAAALRASARRVEPNRRLVWRTDSGNELNSLTTALLRDSAGTGTAG